MDNLLSFPKKEKGMAHFHPTVKHAVNPSRGQVLSLDRVDTLLGNEKPKPQVEAPPLSAGAIEARELLKKAEQLKKEQEMTLLGEKLRAKLEEAAKRESLNNTLNEWDKDEQKQIKGEIMSTTKQHLFGVSNNASRATFDFVKANPNLKIREIVDRLHAQGFKESTISSLVYQMVAVGMLVKDEASRFHAVVPQFVPYSISKIRKAKKQKQIVELEPKPNPRKVVVVKRRTTEDVAQAQGAAGIGALTVNTDQPLQARPRPWRPEDTVDQLTLVQAKAVHAYLQKIFGAL